MRMIKAIIAIMVALAAMIAQAGDSAPLMLDIADGTRVAREVETIAYSTAWDNGTTVRIAVDGVTLKEVTAPATGDVTWNAANAGVGYHTLTHTTYKNGVADKVETVTFQVKAIYTVTFAANGGSLEMASATRSVVEGTAIGTLPTPTRTGHAFAGWWTAASGGTQISAATTVTADETFYAHWKVLTAKTRIYCDAVYTVVPGKPCNIPITVVSSIKKTTVSVKGLPSGLKYSGGKISGKAKKPGTSKVTITAKNTKGTVTKKITIKVRNPGFSVTVVPMTVNGRASNDYDDITSSGQTITVRVGFRQSFALTATPGIADVASSSASLKVSGLPSGLSYKNGTITGVVRKAGTKTVTVKCTNKWGWSKTFKLKIKALALPSAVVGTFNGYTTIKPFDIFDENGISTNAYMDCVFDYHSRQVNATATSGGKLSAKIGSTSWISSAWMLDDGGFYRAELKKATDDNARLCLLVDPLASWTRFQMTGEILYRYVSEYGSSLSWAACDDYCVVAQRNPFGKNSKKKYVNVMAGKIVTTLEKYGTMETNCGGVADVYALGGPACMPYRKGYKFPLSFKVSAAGKVTVAGKMGGLKMSGTTFLHIMPPVWAVDSSWKDDNGKWSGKLPRQALFCLSASKKNIRMLIEFNYKSCRHGLATIGEHMWYEYFNRDDEDEWDDDE